MTGLTRATIRLFRVKQHRRYSSPIRPPLTGTFDIKKFLIATFFALAPIVSVVGVLTVSTSIANADELRFDFSSRKAADASYARVFAQFSAAGSRAFLRDVKKLVIVQFSPDGTVSGGRKAIERTKPTDDQYFAAMAKALDGKTAAEVMADAEQIRD